MSIFTDLSAFAVKFLPSCHLLICSTLLGTELYQTFVMTKICYNALPRSAFRTLQKRVFPVYFKMQAALVFLNVVTFPSSAGVMGLASNKSDWIPHLIAGVTAMLNLSIYEPRTRRSMIQIAHQETRDSQNSLLEGTDGPTLEMQQLKRRFSRDHAMCIHLNLISLGAMLFYGFRLASRLDVCPTV